MKKLITVTLILLMMAMTFVSVFAQEGDMRSIDVIVMDIREDLGLSEDATIDPTLVDVALLYELGDSVMEAYFNNTELHEEWDVYLGGENSEITAATKTLLCKPTSRHSATKPKLYATTSPVSAIRKARAAWW